jgi:hypothetical protein
MEHEISFTCSQGPATIPNLIQINSVHTTPPYTLKTNYDIVLIYTPSVPSCIQAFQPTFIISLVRATCLPRYIHLDLTIRIRVQSDEEYKLYNLSLCCCL